MAELLFPRSAPPGPGLGCMRLSDLEPSEAVERIQAALDLGVSFLDTAGVYGRSDAEVGSNERLVAEAVRSWRGNRAEVTIATKGGLTRPGGRWIPDGRAKHLRTACEASLERLGVDTIDLYQLHTPDPRVPLATSMRALARLQTEGKVRHIGLCNVGLEELEEACDLAKIAAVQVALGPSDLGPLKSGLALECARRGILLIAHSPFGGPRNARRLARHPAFEAIALRHSLAGAAPEQRRSHAHVRSPHAAALAWLHSLSPNILPIPGSTSAEHIAENVTGSSVELAETDHQELASAFPAAAAFRNAISRPGKKPVAPATKRSLGEVVLIIGYPAAGKSTVAKEWVERGYERLNRDQRGGRLSGLLAPLERRLTTGTARVVMDNTYPTRASRFDVIQLAHRLGARARCLWLTTSLEEAQVNAVERMVQRHGRLLAPEEMKSVGKHDPGTFGPGVLFRHRRTFEEPRKDEGFDALERLPFERNVYSDRLGKALLIEESWLLEAGEDEVATLRRRQEDGFRLLCLAWRPEGARDAIAETKARAHGLEIEYAACRHPAGPPICWCRKPLPGLGVALAHQHQLDLSSCLLIASSAADRGFAARLGIRLLCAR